MTYFLGIASSHDSSACLFANGKLIAAVSQERMTRIKCDGFRLPFQAIDEVLRLGGISRNQVTHIALICGFIPEKYFIRENWGKRAESCLKNWLHSLKQLPDRYMNVNDALKRLNGDLPALHEMFRTKNFLRDYGFSPTTKVQFFDHHETHAACAAFYSGFPSAAVVTLDGKGDLNIHHTASIWKNGTLKKIRITDVRGTSAGEFYEAITVLLGFRSLRHEGKVLGLAAYGDPAPLKAQFSRALKISKDGKHLDSDFIGENAEKRRVEFLKQAIPGHSRENIAAAAQAVFEETLVQLIKNFMHETGEKNLAVNGGVFANVKLNQRLANLQEVETLFVYPAMSDTGNSVGAALLMQNAENETYLVSQAHRLEHVYLGASYTTDETQSFLQNSGLQYEKLGINEVVEKTAQAIHAGKVVGWFQGAMEFGPRALGNRSMVAAATDRNINVWLNERLERTEFMPFAPSVLAEAADTLFDNTASGSHAAEFMTITFDVKPEWHEKIPAVVHVDGTARPQFVRKDRNPIYHQLISRYQEISGIPVVLNTSFNVHEEPIVCSPKEALQALQDKRIDALAIGEYWVGV